MIKYDIDYYMNLLRIHSSTAQEIVTKRFNFIREHIPEMDWVNYSARQDEEGYSVTVQNFSMLDYGCGVGFMKAFAPDNFNVDTFDIMSVPQTGITQDLYDLITMYDVLEHIPDFKEVEPVLQRGRYVVISVPIKPDDLPWDQYKHFKPSEHLHYFTDDLLEHIFRHMGFDLVASGDPECPPRKYIKSYVFKNKNL